MLVTPGGAPGATASTPPAAVQPSRLAQRHPLLPQVARFMLVAGLGTVVNAVLFLALRTWWDPLPANLVSLVLSTAVSTEANRLFTFSGMVPRRWRTLVHSAGTVVFYAGYSSLVLVILGMLVDAPTPVYETLAIALASLLGGVCRFQLLRQWVFGGPSNKSATNGAIDR